MGVRFWGFVASKLWLQVSGGAGTMSDEELLDHFKVQNLIRVRQLRHDSGPFLTRFSAPYHPHAPCAMLYLCLYLLDPDWGLRCDVTNSRLQAYRVRGHIASDTNPLSAKGSMEYRCAARPSLSHCDLPSPPPSH